MYIVSVAIAVPLRTSFDYLSDKALAIGVRVLVVFAGRKMVGVVIGLPDSSMYLGKIKFIETVLDETPILNDIMLDFLKWAAKYYHHPIGEVIHAALPKNLRLAKAAKIKKMRVAKKGETSQNKTPDEPILNQMQKDAIAQILKAENTYRAFLLHGVTGSGKTEVYLHIAKRMLEKNKQTLILVPEIGLTPQMIKRFEMRFNTRVTLIHSRLSQSEKVAAYLYGKANQASVILGTRSAIFTPAENLGIIIVDEEHDSSFKQQSGFRYCARDLSFVLAKVHNIPLILGSATPSLETLYNSTKEKITHLSLPIRAGNAHLPRVSLIDIKNQHDALSPDLLQKIATHLAYQKQVMLFINRRGYAPIYHCYHCGWQAKCAHCSVRLVLHHGSHRLKCHHCGFEMMPHVSCPLCHEQKLGTSGYGTERLAEILYTHFPKINIIRIDKDTTRKKEAMAHYLKRINRDEPCLIIGTQMLSKGHDFAHLSMVGIVDADASFFSLDFRATEKLAQLLMQVAGRAGRGKDKGEVYIQTRQINHPLFHFIKAHNYTKLARTLLTERKEAGLPPFSYQALICANAKKQEKALNFLENIAVLLKSFAISRVEIWGPSSAIIEKKADYFYANLYLSSKNRTSLHTLLDKLHENEAKIKGKSGVRWFLDVDPIE